MTDEWSGKIYRIAIVGEENVGKTYTIHKTFFYNNLHPYNYIYKSTTGDTYEIVFIRDKSISNVKDLIRIYDTPSLNKNNVEELAKCYSPLVDAFLLMFDMNVIETLEKLKLFKRYLSQTKQSYNRNIFHLLGKIAAEAWCKQEKIEYTEIHEHNFMQFLISLKSITEKLNSHIHSEHKKGFFRKK